jgi:serine/threonine-protein kinase
MVSGDASSGLTGGSYRIVRRLAQGGMAELFIGKHVSVAGFSRTVAVKRILPEHASDPSFVESFFNEARLAARLNHPNVVQIYDLARDAETYFMVMEYIEGFDLEAVIAEQGARKEPMPLDVAFTIVTDLCRGLHFAHRAVDEAGAPLGIVHRDATPSNVIVTLGGQSKIVDFGIAKATAQSDKRTQTGVLKGKLSYVSPEQVLNKPIDHRVDVFSTGIVLYETLTNKNPFRGDSTYASLHNIAVGDYRRLRDARAGLPEALYALVDKALLVDRDQRVQTCAEIEQALLQIAKDEGMALSYERVASFIDQRYSGLRARRPLRDATPEGESDAAGFDLELHTVTAEAIVEPINSTRELITRETKTPARWPWLVGAVAVVAIAAIAPRLLRTPAPPPIVAPVEGASLEITSTPPGAQVLIDGVLRTGVTPLVVTYVRNGSAPHVVVYKAGMTRAEQQVTIDAPGRRALAFSLGTDAAPPPAKPAEPERRAVAKKPTVVTAAPEPSTDPGTVRVVVHPWGSVSLDGQALGETPFPPKSIAPGKHVIEISNSKLGKHTRKEIVVQPGKETLVQQDFAKD